MVLDDALLNFFSNFLFTFLIIYSGDIEVTVEFLIEMDKLVQLIESPIFACKSMHFRILFCVEMQ